MKIEKIKKMSNGKYQLILDNKEVITTYDEIIINNMLFNGKELNNALLSEISLKNNYYDLYNKIIKMISTKWRSIYEIKEFLKKNNFEDSDSIINDLKAKGLLNDLRYAKSYASDQINLTKVGPYKIKSNLEKLKIDKEIIEEVMATLNDDLIHENLVNIVLKKNRLNNHYSLFQLKTKLKLELTNMGYETNDINDVLNKYLTVDDNIAKKEYEKLKKKYEKKYQGKELEFKLKQAMYQKGFSISE